MFIHATAVTTSFFLLGFARDLLMLLPLAVVRADSFGFLTSTSDSDAAICDLENKLEMMDGGAE